MSHSKNKMRAKRLWQQDSAGRAVVTVPTESTLAERLYKRLEEFGVIGSLKPDGGDYQPLVAIPVADRPMSGLQEIMDETRQVALANQTYYLQEAAKQGKPWFQCPKHRYQYSEFVSVNSEMAKVALGHNPDNRRMREDHARSLARDIGNNRWLPTAESVSFDVRGELQNGQHRMYAIILANGEAAIYVTWNVAVESKFVVDAGIKRSTTDKLRPIANQRISNKTSAVIRACIAGVRPRGRFTDSEIAEFLLTHEDNLRWVARQLPMARADVQAVVLKGYLWYGPAVMETFCEKYRKMIFPTDSDPVGLLYKWLNRLKEQGKQVTPVIVYRKTLNALEHFVNRREPRALYEREVDLFEWNPGYTVPSRIES